MSTMRYSGKLRIRVTYCDNYGNGLPPGKPFYRCYIVGNWAWRSADRQDNPRGVTVHVGAPAHLTHAVDSPEAFDAAARAALSFAHNDGWPVESHAAWVDDAGWHIGRSPAKAWPPREGMTSLQRHESGV